MTAMLGSRSIGGLLLLVLGLACAGCNTSSGTETAETSAGQTSTATPEDECQGDDDCPDSLCLFSGGRWRC